MSTWGSGRHPTCMPSVQEAALVYSIIPKSLTHMHVSRFITPVLYNHQDSTLKMQIWNAEAETCKKSFNLSFFGWGETLTCTNKESNKFLSSVLLRTKRFLKHCKLYSPSVHYTSEWGVFIHTLQTLHICLPRAVAVLCSVLCCQFKSLYLLCKY